MSPAEVGAAATAAAQLLQATGHTFESRLQGPSMGDTIPSDSAIRIRCVAAAELRTGDVVAFLRGPTLVAHRVMARGRRGRAAGFLIAGGDGTVVCDPPVPLEAVLGRVEAYQAGGDWRSIPLRRLRPGWRDPAGALLVGAMRVALEVNVQLATMLADAARTVRRLRWRLRGRRPAPSTGRQVGDPWPR